LPALLLTAALPCTASRAAEIALELSPAQTHVTWTLGSALHTVHGTFKLTRGTIRFDPATGTASGEMIVDAASGESGNGARDGRMHKHVLETAKYPAITFKPDRVEGTVNLDGDSQVQLHGLFGIHGAEHELTVPAKVHFSKVHFSNSQMNATMEFLVPYVKWGMKDPGTLFLKVKDTVAIEVQTTATVE
jgi:polyisoprenoid-binding protein YceI